MNQLPIASRRLFVASCQLMFAIFILAVATRVEAASDELKRQTWSVPDHETVRERVQQWLESVSTDVNVAEQVAEQWQEPVDAESRLLLLVDSIARLREEARPLIEHCRSVRESPAIPEFPVLDSSDISRFERDHLRLMFGQWLAQNAYYDETLAQLDGIQTDDVVDPAALLFYRSVALHRLLQKDACLPVVDRLLENEAELPRRFRTLAQLIRVDLEPLETDSLDEVSRLMANVQVRLGHARAGKRVRDEEDKVIEKLDKMIEKLEQQAQDAAAAAAAAASGKAGNSPNPSTPMEDSMPGGVKGPGNVDAKDIGQKSGWGNLPPKERQQALQQLGEDFPSHYRDVIEEYFRKLAREGSAP